MTPRLDNILEKARLDQLRGQLLELRGKSKKHKTPKRYTVYIAVVNPAFLDPRLNEFVNTIVSGWGLLADNGNLASVLQEITVSFLEYIDC